MAPLPRRRVLQLAALGSAVAAGSALVGCRRPSAAGLLLSVRGEGPSAWFRTLPEPWRSQPLADPEAVLAAVSRNGSQEALLLSLGDGWAQQLAPRQLQPLGAERLLAELAPFAQAASRLWAAPGRPALAYPWAFGTWMLLLRNRPDLGQRRQEGWRLLLDPSLRRRLVLPSSPRLVLDLACRQLGWNGAQPSALEDPRLPAQLRRLVRQAVALDEQDGLNLLLAGDAEAAVLPSQRVIPLLLSDPRLEGVLPASGAPLWWQLLLRPVSGRAMLDPPLPLEWLRDGLQLPLLDRLLAGGWVPPLPADRLRPALARWPERVRSLLRPDDALLERCSSLPAWTEPERQRWQALWDAALAGHAPS